MNDRPHSPQSTEGLGRFADATRVIGRFVATVRYDDLPPAVKERAQLALLDWIGAAWVGVDSDSARQVRALLIDLSGPPECTVIGQRERMPVLHAALLNGIQAAIYEVDDVHLDCRIHPGLPVISAAFSLAQRERASGQRLIEAIVAGYEVIVRMAITLGVPHNNWWHSTGTAGAIGAAVAAAKILNLDAEQCASAIGLGATQGAGLIDGTEGKALAAKHFHGAKAAQNGIWSALLAARGFLGSRTAIEAEWGFLRAFSKGNHQEQSALLNRLGDEWYILRTISKPFACCLSAHAGIHALLALVRKHGLEPDHVASVEAYTHPSSYYMINNADPRDELQAKFSLPFCLAAALVHQDVSYRAFEDRFLFDPTIRAAMSKVTLQTNEAMGRIETLVRVRTHDGKLLEQLAQRSSLDAEGIVTKARNLLATSLGPGRVDEIVQAATELAACENVGTLGATLSSG